MISGLHSSKGSDACIQGWDWEVEAESSVVAHDGRDLQMARPTATPFDALQIPTLSACCNGDHFGRY